jgi:hypothetical protein
LISWVGGGLEGVANIPGGIRAVAGARKRGGGIGFLSLEVGAHMQHEVVLVFGLLVANGTLELGLDAALEAQVPVEAVRPGVRVAAPRTRVRAALLHQRRRGRRRRVRGAPRSRRQRRRRRRTRSSVRRRRPHGQNLGIQVDSAAACKKQGAPHTLVRPTVSNSTIAFMIVSLRGCDLRRGERGCAGWWGGWVAASTKAGAPHIHRTQQRCVGVVFVCV